MSAAGYLLAMRAQDGIVEDVAAAPLHRGPAGTAPDPKAEDDPAPDSVPSHGTSDASEDGPRAGADPSPSPSTVPLRDDGEIPSGETDTVRTSPGDALGQISPQPSMEGPPDQSPDPPESSPDPPSDEGAPQPVGAGSTGRGPGPQAEPDPSGGNATPAVNHLDSPEGSVPTEQTKTAVAGLLPAPAAAVSHPLQRQGECPSEPGSVEKGIPPEPATVEAFTRTVDAVLDRIAGLHSALVQREIQKASAQFLLQCVSVTHHAALQEVAGHEERRRALAEAQSRRMSWGRVVRDARADAVHMDLDVASRRSSVFREGETGRSRAASCVMEYAERGEVPEDPDAFDMADTWPLPWDHAGDTPVWGRFRSSSSGRFVTLPHTLPLHRRPSGAASRRASTITPEVQLSARQMPEADTPDLEMPPNRTVPPLLRADLLADGAAGTPRRTAASPQAPARSPGRPSPRQPAGTPPLSPRRSTTSPSLGRAAAAANAAVPALTIRASSFPNAGFVSAPAHEPRLLTAADSAPPTQRRPIASTPSLQPGFVFGLEASSTGSSPRHFAADPPEPLAIAAVVGSDGAGSGSTRSNSPSSRRGSRPASAAATPHHAHPPTDPSLPTVTPSLPPTLADQTATSSSQFDVTAPYPPTTSSSAAYAAPLPPGVTPWPPGPRSPGPLSGSWTQRWAPLADTRFSRHSFVDPHRLAGLDDTGPGPNNDLARTAPVATATTRIRRARSYSTDTCRVSAPAGEAAGSGWWYFDEVGNRVFVNHLQLEVEDRFAGARVVVPRYLRAAEAGERRCGRCRTPLSARSPLATSTSAIAPGRVRPPLFDPATSLAASPIYPSHADPSRPPEFHNISPAVYSPPRRKDDSSGPPTADPYAPKLLGQAPGGPQRRPRHREAVAATPAAAPAAVEAPAPPSAPLPPGPHPTPMLINAYVTYDPLRSYLQYCDRRRPLGNLRYGEMLAELKAEELELLGYEATSPRAPQPPLEDLEADPHCIPSHLSSASVTSAAGTPSTVRRRLHGLHVSQALT